MFVCLRLGTLVSGDRLHLLATCSATLSQTANGSARTIIEGLKDSQCLLRIHHPDDDRSDKQNDQDPKKPARTMGRRSIRFATRSGDIYFALLVSPLTVRHGRDQQRCHNEPGDSNGYPRNSPIERTDWCNIDGDRPQCQEQDKKKSPYRTPRAAFT